MAGLMVLINIVAVVANYGKTSASGWAVASLVASIWAFGIFSNYRRDPMNAPNYAVFLSTLTGLTGIVLAIIGFAS